MILLNIGCGSICHKAWVNLDACPSTPFVRQWDIRNGVPFANGQADAIYMSHVVEHLSRADAVALIKECRRVLRSGGIIRVVVPDLEAIAVQYLRLLKETESNASGVIADYDWMMLELFDQMVRAKSGGEMYQYLISGQVVNAEFVLSRVGSEAQRLMSAKTENCENKGAVSQGFLYYWRRLCQKAVVHIGSLLLGGGSRSAIEHALLRHSGQIHLWMYDRFSLHRLLQEAGFVEMTRYGATESRIPDFAAYQLDAEDGLVRKPDSLFMEAINP